MFRSLFINCKTALTLSLLWFINAFQSYESGVILLKYAFRLKTVLCEFLNYLRVILGASIACAELIYHFSNLQKYSLLRYPRKHFSRGRVYTDENCFRRFGVKNPFKAGQILRLGQFLRYVKLKDIALLIFA